MTALDQDVSQMQRETAVRRAAGSGVESSDPSYPQLPVRQLFVLMASIIVAALGGAWSVSVFGNSDVEQQVVMDSLRAELQHFVRQEIQGTSSSEDRLVPLIQDESGRIVAAELAGWARQDSVRTEQLQQVLGEVLRNQLALREDLETLAMEAEAQILQTRRELVRVSMDVIPDGRTNGGLPPNGGADSF